MMAQVEEFGRRVEPLVHALRLLAQEMSAKLGELGGGYAGFVRITLAREAAAPPDKERLTPHEVLVVQLAALDGDNAQIAAELRIAPRTVKSYWRAIYWKQGLHTGWGAVGRLLGHPPAGGYLPSRRESTPIRG
jgi:DNA-binding NarL/FixJ family response regulator